MEVKDKILSQGMLLRNSAKKKEIVWALWSRE
jgi:hypothetical protein